MAKKSIKKNYLYNVSYQILLLITPLITTPYVSRILGADGIGTYSYANSIMTYLVMLVTLGTYHYGQREISYFQDDKHGRSVSFWNIVAVRWVNVAICLVIYLAIILTASLDDRIIYLILTCSLVEVAFDVTWFFQGLEDFGRIVKRNIFFKVISISSIFIFVKTKEDLPIYVFIIAGLAMIGNMSLWMFVPKYVEKVSLKELKPWANIREIISLFIPTIAIDVYTVLDKVMIGLFTVESFENGYYEQALRISKMVLTIITAYGTVMIPRIGHYFAQKDHNKIRESIYKGYNFVWFMSVPMCFGLFCVSDNIVPWFYGPGFDKVGLLLKFSCFLIIFIGISNVTGRQYLIPTKQQNTYTKTVVIGAAVNVLLNAFLIPRFYSVGAIIASISAEFAIALSQILFMRKEISLLHILKLSRHYVFAGLVMSAVLLFMNRFLTSSIFHSCLMVGTGMIIYFGVLLLIRDKFLLDNTIHVITSIRKRKK